MLANIVCLSGALSLVRLWGDLIVRGHLSFFLRKGREWYATNPFLLSSALLTSYMSVFPELHSWIPRFFLFICTMGDLPLHSCGFLFLNTVSKIHVLHFWISDPHIPLPTRHHHLDALQVIIADCLVASPEPFFLWHPSQSNGTHICLVAQKSWIILVLLLASFLTEGKSERITSLSLSFRMCEMG